MGGNLYTTRRLAAAEYHPLVSSFVSSIKSVLPGSTVKAIPAYKSKPDFGDLDILVSTKDPTYKEKISRVFNHAEWSTNGECTSYPMQLCGGGVFQLDIIYADEETLDFSYNYFSFNDLGNLVGRIAHKLKFKLGHRGLYYIIREDDDDSRVVSEICVTTDWHRALALFSYAPLESEPDTLEDIFKYAVSSPYVNKEMFLLENRNHISRTRDRKRKTYQEFLLWLASPANARIVPKFDWSDKARLRTEFLQKAFITFPDFKVEYDAAIDWNARRKTHKLKFNGLLVSAWTGLTHKELGAFLTAYKKSTGMEADKFVDYINRCDPEFVEYEVRKFYRIYSHTPLNDIKFRCLSEQ